MNVDTDKLINYISENAWKSNTTEKQIEILGYIIDSLDYYYWKLNTPIVIDSKYDELKNELLKLDPNNERKHKVHAALPTSTNRQKIKRDTPMLSLNKKYSIKEILEWCTSVARSPQEVFSIQAKLDGIAAEYKNGILSTRGDDGITGENISDRIPYINLELGNDRGNSIEPLSQIKSPHIGEIIVRKSVFEATKHTLLRKDKKPYANCRSACVGLISREDSIPMNIVSFAVYDIFKMEMKLCDMYSYPWEGLIQNIKDWDYPTDGLVFKLKDINYAHSLGYTSHHPKGAIALKYTNPNARTTLLGIKIQVGKDVLTPVGEIAPVNLSGSNVTHVNLHNAKFIIDHDLQIGDSFIVEKSGDVIPNIPTKDPQIERGKERFPFTIDNCPICNSQVIYEDPNLKCSNDNCLGRNLKKLTDSVSRLGIKGISTSTIEKMITFGKIKNIIDILEISYDNIFNFPGFAETSSRNCYNEIQRIKNIEIEDWKVLACLNIKGIGISFSKQLLTQYSINDLINLTIDKLIEIDNVGDIVAENLFFGLKENKEILKSLFSILNVVTTKDKIIKNIGSICFTGANSLPKKYWIAAAEKIGFEHHKSIKKNTSMLVTNDLESSKNKMEKAKKYNIPIILYDEFAKRYIKE